MAEVFGAVELVAITFPQDRVPDEVKAQVALLVAAEQVRIIDLVVVRRPDEDTLDVVELTDIDGDGDLDFLETELVGLGLAGQEDIDAIAGDLEVGTSALVIVFEHLWSRGVAAAARAAGGVLVTSERIPAEVVAAIVELAELDHAEAHQADN
ncbi:MAG: DUF6325 family protein [Brevundimonas sp.]